jgi:hypothetical protein
MIAALLHNTLGPICADGLFLTGQIADPSLKNTKNRPIDADIHLQEGIGEPSVEIGWSPSGAPVHRTLLTFQDLGVPGDKVS